MDSEKKAMPIPFEGRLTRDEFFLFQKVVTPRWFYNAWWVPLGLLALLSSISLFLLSSGDSRLEGGGPLWDLLRGGLALLIMTVAFFVLPRLSGWNDWKRNRRLQDPVKGLVDDDGVEWKSSHFSASLDWEDFLRYRSGETMVALFTAPRQALYFPRSFFGGEPAWQKFRRLVAEKLARK